MLREEGGDAHRTKQKITKKIFFFFLLCITNSLCASCVLSPLFLLHNIQIFQKVVRPNTQSEQRQTDETLVFSENATGRLAGRYT